MEPVLTPASSDATEVASRLLEFIGKTASSLVALWVVVEKIAKPYYSWRKRKQGELIREVLADELSALGEVAQSAERITAALETIAMSVTGVYEHIALVVDLVEAVRLATPEADERATELTAVLRDRIATATSASTAA